MTVRSVIIFDEHCPEFASTVRQWLSDAKIKTREHRVESLENTSQAYINLLESRNVGTMLVQGSAESQ